MGEMDDQVRAWESMKKEALVGNLRLDPSVDDDCKPYFDAIIDACEARMRQAQFAGRVQGLGDFEPAHQLATILRAAAVGGPGSALYAFEQHKKVLELMRDTISAAVGRLTAQDEQTAAVLANADVPK